VLPANVDESKNILSWVKENLPSDTYVSLMSQYTPYGNTSEFKELNRRLTTAEYNKVVDFFFALDLENGFMQEKTSAKTDFIPSFDNTGVEKI
jgi:putative pyruvate formate lyase activating enzyme